MEMEASPTARSGGSGQEVETEMTKRDLDKLSQSPNFSESSYMSLKEQVRRINR